MRKPSRPAAIHVSRIASPAERSLPGSEARWEANREAESVTTRTRNRFSPRPWRTAFTTPAKPAVQPLPVRHCHRASLPAVGDCNWRRSPSSARLAYRAGPVYSVQPSRPQLCWRAAEIRRDVLRWSPSAHVMASAPAVCSSLPAVVGVAVTLIAVAQREHQTGIRSRPSSRLVGVALLIADLQPPGGSSKSQLRYPLKFPWWTVSPGVFALESGACLATPHNGPYASYVHQLRLPPSHPVSALIPSTSSQEKLPVGGCRHARLQVRLGPRRKFQLEQTSLILPLGLLVSPRRPSARNVKCDEPPVLHAVPRAPGGPKLTLQRSPVINSGARPGPGSSTMMPISA